MDCLYTFDLTQNVQYFNKYYYILIIFTRYKTDIPFVLIMLNTL